MHRGAPNNPPNRFESIRLERDEEWDPVEDSSPKTQFLRDLSQTIISFNDSRNPVSIITKNHLVTRDLDLLRELAAHHAVMVHLSINSLDPGLARKLEPRAASPHGRLEAVETLSKAGVPVGVLVAPVIPALNDHEIPSPDAPPGRSPTPLVPARESTNARTGREHRPLRKTDLHTPNQNALRIEPWILDAAHEVTAQPARILIRPGPNQTFGLKPEFVPHGWVREWFWWLNSGRRPALPSATLRDADHVISG
jgi:hypothetical protein